MTRIRTIFPQKYTVETNTSGLISFSDKIKVTLPPYLENHITVEPIENEKGSEL